MDAEPIGDDIEKTTFGSVFFNQDVGHDTRGDLCTADMKSFEEENKYLLYGCFTLKNIIYLVLL